MSRLLSKPKVQATDATAAPQLYPVGTRSHCPLPSTGKYWGWAYGGWQRVMVEGLPRGGGTGSLVFAPVGPSSWRVALANCQAFWGPVKSWGKEPPWVPVEHLKAVGVKPPQSYRKPAKPGSIALGTPLATKRHPNDF